MTPDAAGSVASRSLLRERNARKEAESLLEQKSRELYDINLDLRALNARIEESEVRYRTLVELMPDPIWIHRAGQLVYLNPAALRLFGADAPARLLGTPAAARVPPEWRRQLAEGTYHDIAAAQAQPRCALRLARLDGTLVDVEYFGCAIRYQQDDAVMCVAHDITERLLHEKAIEHQATHDLLTGLPNRAVFLDRLQHAIRRAERHQGRLAVMFVDLDKFKQVNDVLGHGAGDELLRQVAAILRQCVRELDTVARLGGDEFVLLLDYPLGQATPATVAERIGARLGRPVLLNGQQHVVTGSIGISVYPDDGTRPEALLSQADIAMYRAKESGRNGFQFFTREMQRQLDARVVLEQGLRRALERDEFVLHYQPQLDLGSGRIVGIEALLRWQSPELGLVPPLQFIPVAEESNLILSIGRWVMERACATLRDWLRDGLAVVPMALNVAATQFAHQDLEQLLTEMLARYGLAPQLLELELTESLSMDNPEQSIMRMQRLKQIGIAMSIDDFGTGYSNLSYLKRFPIDKLKIDQSFTRGLTCNPEDHAIVTAVIRLAHSLGLRAIAEGVETQGQLRLLKLLGCDEIQGYYYSRPLAAEGMAALLRGVPGLDLAPLTGGGGPRTVLLLHPEPAVLREFERLLAAHPYRLLTARRADEAYELLAREEVGAVISAPAPDGAHGMDFFERVRRIYPGAVRLALGDGHTGPHDATHHGGAGPARHAHVLEALTRAFAAPVL